MNLHYLKIWVESKIKDKKGEIGMSAIINTAVALIIAGFILVPSLRTLATSMTKDLSDWYDKSIKTVMFSDK